MNHTNDRSYLATCTRFGITPSVEDYAEYLAEAGAAAPEPEYEFDGEQIDPRA